MRRYFINLCLIWLSLLAGAAQGQSADSGSPLLVAPQGDAVAPPNSLQPQPVPLVPQQPPRPQWFPPQASAQDAPPSRYSLPTPTTVGLERQPPGSTPPASSAPSKAASATPPPDPQMPSWGNYLEPLPVPVELPAGEYDLVSPPRGIIQRSQRQNYRRVLGDPSRLVYDDAQMLQTIDLYRPDGLAPAGMFNDHTLPTGRVLVSYRYLQQSFDDLYVNQHQVSAASVQANYTYVPQRMFQNNQVALIEYGVTDDFTINAMLPFQHTLIDYTSLGGNIATGFTNPGDVRLQGLYVVRRKDNRQHHVNFGLSVPVGFLEDVFNETPSPSIPNLSYPLRTSSGTFDLLMGYTIRGQSQHWTWGLQASGVVHTGINTLNYKLGDSADLSAWLSRRLSQRWSVSGRLDTQFQGNIFRADARLNLAQAPTNDPNAYGYERVNGLLGVNFFWPDGRIPGQRVSVEAGLPLQQSMEGPQLGLDWILNASWNMIF